MLPCSNATLTYPLPGSALAAVAVVHVFTWLQRRSRKGFILVLVVVLLGSYMYGESRFLHERLREWRLASELVNKMLSMLEEDIEDSVKEIYLVDFPRGVPGTFWPAYAFGNASGYLPAMLRPRRDDVKVNVVFTR